MIHILIIIPFFASPAQEAPVVAEDFASKAACQAAADWINHQAREEIARCFPKSSG